MGSCFQNCSVSIDHTSLKGVKDMSKIEYDASLKSLAFNYRTHLEEKKGCTDSSLVLFNLFISDVLLQNSRDKLVELKQLTIEAKVIKILVCF